MNFGILYSQNVLRAFLIEHWKAIAIGKIPSIKYFLVKHNWHDFVYEH